MCNVKKEIHSFCRYLYCLGPHFKFTNWQNDSNWPIFRWPAVKHQSINLYFENLFKFMSAVPFIINTRCSFHSSNYFKYCFVIVGSNTSHRPCASFLCHCQAFSWSLWSFCGNFHLKFALLSHWQVYEVELSIIIVWPLKKLGFVLHSWEADVGEDITSGRKLFLFLDDAKMLQRRLFYFSLWSSEHLKQIAIPMLHLRFCCRILRFFIATSWTTSAELSSRLGIECNTDMLRRSRLWWFGHVERKDIKGYGWLGFSM